MDTNQNNNLSNPANQPLQTSQLPPTPQPTTQSDTISSTTPTQPLTVPQNTNEKSRQFGFNTETNTTPTKSKRPHMFFIIGATVLIGITIPATVFIARQQHDTRGRAAEIKKETTQAPLPIITPSPTPTQSPCNASCTVHADCIAGYFCNGSVCKNALCSNSNNCVCE